MRDSHLILRRFQSAIQHFSLAKSRIFEVLGHSRPVLLGVQTKSTWINQERRRLALAVSISLLLHLVLLLFLLPPQTGLASFGTTGLGNVNGPGMAVTLVEASEIVPPKTATVQSSASDSTLANPETVTTAEADDPLEETKPLDPTEAKAETTDSQADTVKSEGPTEADSVADATAGAHGQNGQADMDLWNAIAPCWNKIIDQTTVAATLTISFDANGEIASPPVIERDLTQPVTPQSLKSESLALQALAACGAYPMVKGQQNMTVQFLLPGQIAEALPSKQMTALATPH